MPRFRILTGDCLPLLRAMEPGSVDAVVTDPPYGLSFMGKRWDHDVPSVEVWAECLRVLKPGGHLLAFAGTRTQHRMAVRIEDAGFEIRDLIAWVYGSGFPKSLDVSKALDAKAGAEREVIGVHPNPAGNKVGGNSLNMSAVGMPTEAFITAPATDAARQWQGWGTALKPALEPITVARKPLIGTVAANVLTHGTGALNIDGCRIDAGGDNLNGGATVGSHGKHEGWRRPWMEDNERNAAASERAKARVANAEQRGRFPANLIHDGSDDVVAGFPFSTSNDPGTTMATADGWGHKGGRRNTGYAGDSGSAARFFYCAKASKADRNAGCEALPLQVAGGMSGRRDGSMGSTTYNNNNHPTVKPTDLMRYLCRLVTPPGGVVLDPFAGSGSTGRGAVMEGFHFIGCELDPEYAALAEKRIAEAMEEVALIAQTDPEPENPSLFD